MIKVRIALASLAILASPAAAVTITFDDFDGQNSITIPNGYEGFDWANFYVLNGVTYEPSGYQNGVVSPDFVALNGFGQPATISSPTAFSLTSGYLTGAWNDGLTITLTGTLLGNAVYTQSFVVSTSGPTLESFNHALVDKVVFSSAGGTHNSAFNGNGTHFALDNLTINGAGKGGTVPEPASWALMIAGFGMVGGAMRRQTTKLSIA